MKPVGDHYQEYRQRCDHTKALKHWDELSPQERALIHGIAMSVSKEALDAFCLEIETQARLATDKKLAALKANPSLKISERRLP